MFHEHNDPAQPQQNTQKATANYYLAQAGRAVESHDLLLGMHLYLAAFEEIVQAEQPDESLALATLEKAWQLAMDIQERSMAEYIYERLELFVDQEQLEEYADSLQNLALTKLDELGLSSDDIRDMANMLNDELFTGELPPFMDVSQLGPGGEEILEMISQAARAELAEMALAAEEGSAQTQDPKPSDNMPQKVNPVAPHDDEAPKQEKPAPHAAHDDSRPRVRLRTAKHHTKEAQEEVPATQPRALDELDGYTRARAAIRDYGFGMEATQAGKELMKSLSEAYGIEHPPATQTVVFKAASRKDASIFMSAVATDMQLPLVRMTVEEGPQGIPMLCMMSTQEVSPRRSGGRLPSLDTGVLILEDIDQWGPMVLDHMLNEDMEAQGLTAQQAIRGIQEALGFVRLAVQNPQCYVFASVDADNDLTDSFFDWLEPIEVFEIDLPTIHERYELIHSLSLVHPVLARLNLGEIVAFTNKMSREDIRAAVADALELSYKESLKQHRFVGLTRAQLAFCIAAYQPLDSEEYALLEQIAVADFLDDISNIDDVLKR